MIKLCFYHKIKIILLISNFFVKFYDRQPKLQSELEEREIEIFANGFQPLVAQGIVYKKA